MHSLPIELLSRACRIFLECAYPDGFTSIPVPLRAYWDMPLDADVDDYLLPAPRARGICQRGEGKHGGYRLRLGCTKFPHLKMAVQCVPNDGQESWLFGVDTHDNFHHPEHPDAAAWLALQSSNRELKGRIERAWEDAGLLTLNRLLRMELAKVR